MLEIEHLSCEAVRDVQNSSDGEALMYIGDADLLYRTSSHAIIAASR